MTGYVRADGPNNIADGNIINAADLDGEFDAVVAGFNATTGHKHDGTAAEGAPITKVGPAQDVVVSSSNVTPKTTNVIDVGSSALKFKDVYLTGTVNAASFTASQAIFTDASKNLVSNAITGTGNVVMSTSPTLVTPVLGTPSSVTLTNATGLPVSTGISGLGTGVATLLATPSSANLAAAVTDETGSGSLVFATSPTLVTPALGTPSSATLTNATGLPIATGVSGLGTGVATALAVNVGSAGAAVVNGGALGTPSGGTATNLTGLPLSTGVTGTLPVANGGTGVTTSTGSGNNVLSTSPTLVTPILGTPTSVTLTNATGLPLSTGVTGTLPVANGGTGTASPAIVAGTNITVSGTWPNQTINSTASGSGTVTSVAATVPTFLSVAGSPITTSGTLAITLSGTALPVANGGTGVTTSTGTGNTVLSTSPTLVTPILGTPTSATLTNATGLPISTGVSGLGTGVATALAVNVGTAGAPVVNGGALGTPSGGTLTNATGLPISTGVSGLGTNVATALAINVGSAGAPVVNGGVLGTPSSGTATNLTGLPLSTGVTGTLPIANGGTGTTSTTFVNAATNVTGTLPIANGGTGQTTLAAANIAVVNVANTFTGTQTFSGTSSATAIVLNDAAEVVTVSATAATGTINYDITTQSVLYYTSNASANWTVNFRGSSGTSLDTLMSTGQSMTVAFLVTQGATAYYNSAVQVDGTTSGVTTRWLGGAPTAGNASGIDSYRYLIIKTGSATFTVLASNTQFKA